jgi:hypothetical protein
MWRSQESAPHPSEESLGQLTSGESQWDRGPSREVRAEGTTPSGLPKRVPRANLAEHSTEPSAPSGSSVSRDPEDVRGRLSNLHRGVQRGRGAGTGQAANDQQGFGPGNTYEQER